MRKLQIFSILIISLSFSCLVCAQHNFPFNDPHNCSCRCQMNQGLPPNFPFNPKYPGSPPYSPQSSPNVPNNQNNNAPSAQPNQNTSTPTDQNNQNTVPPNQNTPINQNNPNPPLDHNTPAPSGQPNQNPVVPPEQTNSPPNPIPGQNNQNTPPLPSQVNPIPPIDHNTLTPSGQPNQNNDVPPEQTKNPIPGQDNQNGLPPPTQTNPHIDPTPDQGNPNPPLDNNKLTPSGQPNQNIAHIPGQNNPNPSSNQNSPPGQTDQNIITPPGQPSQNNVVPPEQTNPHIDPIPGQVNPNPPLDHNTLTPSGQPNKNPIVPPGQPNQNIDPVAGQFNPNPSSNQNILPGQTGQNTNIPHGKTDQNTIVPPGQPNQNIPPGPLNPNPSSNQNIPPGQTDQSTTIPPGQTDQNNIVPPGQSNQNPIIPPGQTDQNTIIPPGQPNQNIPHMPGPLNPNPSTNQNIPPGQNDQNIITPPGQPNQNIAPMPGPLKPNPSSNQNIPHGQTDKNTIIPPGQPNKNIAPMPGPLIPNPGQTDKNTIIPPGQINPNIPDPNEKNIAPIPPNITPSSPIVNIRPGTNQTNQQSPFFSNGTFKGHFPKIFAFGDSITDTGNALFVEGLKSFLGKLFLNSHTPYGITTKLPGHRLSNGKLIIDFLCQTIGLPALHPYMQTSANFSTGVNFATGGSTSLSVDFQTTLKSPLSLMWAHKPLNVLNQVDWFNKYLLQTDCNRMPELECKKRIGNSLFWIGAVGYSDYARISDSSSPMEALSQGSVTSVGKLLKALLDRGAKKLVIQGLPPAGCSPLQILLNGKMKRDSMGCSARINGMIKLHNHLLLKKIEKLRLEHPDCTVIYADTFGAYHDILTNYKTNHFLEPYKACCGAGGGSLNFNLNSLCGTSGTSTCKNPKNFISWDGIHFTEAMHEKIADLLFNKGYCHPSFDTLFHVKKKHRHGIFGF